MEGAVAAGRCELAYLVLCDKIEVDEAGRASFIDTFSVLWPPTFPMTIHGRCAVLELADGVPGREFSWLLSVVKPGAPSRSDFTGKHTFGPRGSANFVVPLDGVLLENPGRYRVIFSVDGRDVGARWLYIEHGPMPGTAPSPG
jgi:hypothetical protein